MSAGNSSIETVSTEQVTERFDAAARYAADMYTAYTTFVSEATDIIGAAIDPNLLVKAVNLSLTPPNNTYTEPRQPGALQYAMNAPVLAAAKDLKDDTFSSKVSVPSFTGVRPAINLPSCPSTTLPVGPGSAPSITPYNPPAEPTLTPVSAPNLGAVVLPALPSVDIPAFEGTSPDFDLQAPSISLVYDEEEYASTFGDALDAIILTGLEGDTLGISEETEAAIFARDVSRMDAQRAKLYAESNTYFAARGHELPPGALQAKVLQADKDFAVAIANANTDLTEKQLALTSQYVQLCMKAGLDRENALMQQFNNIASRAFELAKANVQVQLDLFNAQVAYLNAGLEKYKADAAVYAEVIKGKLIALEAYKVQMEGAALEVDVQKAQVELYKSQVEAEKYKIDIYRVQVEAATAQFSAEKLKLEAFQAMVNAYQAELQAKTAEYSLYQARISGELAKVELFDGEVKVFTARVSAFNADKQRVMTEYANQNEINRGIIAENESKIREYQVKYEAEINKLQAAVTEQKGEIDMYLSRMQLEKTRLDTDLSVYRAEADTHFKDAELDLQRAEANMKEKGHQDEMRYKLLETELQVTAQALSSSLTSVNASAAIGYRGGFSSNYSHDMTKGDDSGATTNNSHIWYET